MIILFFFLNRLSGHSPFKVSLNENKDINILKGEFSFKEDEWKNISENG